MTAAESTASIFMRIADFVTQLIQMRSDNVLDIAARRLCRIGENEQDSDFFDAEFQFTGPANEQQPSQLGTCVVAVSSGRARRHGHQSGTFVVADCRDFDTACSRENSDRHSFHGCSTCLHLHLVQFVQSGRRMKQPPSWRTRLLTCLGLWRVVRAEASITSWQRGGPPDEGIRPTLAPEGSREYARGRL